MRYPQDDPKVRQAVAKLFRAGKTIGAIELDSGLSREAVTMVLKAKGLAAETEAEMQRRQAQEARVREARAWATLVLEDEIE